MRASEIKQFVRMGSVTLSDWSLDGRAPEVVVYMNGASNVAFQLWEEAGKYRHTDPLLGQAKPYGDWKQLTPE